MATYNSLTDRTDVQALINEVVLPDILQSLPQQSTVLRVARRLPDASTNVTRMILAATMPEAYFITGSTQTARDYGLKQTTEMSWTSKYLYIEELACIVPIPKNVLADTSYDIWGQIRPRIIESLGKKIDEAILYGTDAPATWPLDITASCAAAGNAIALGSVGTDLYDDLFATGGVVDKVEEDGYMVSGAIAPIAFKSKMRGIRSTTGEPIPAFGSQQLTDNSFYGVSIQYPTNGAIDKTKTWLIAGDWTQIVYSIRQDVTFELFDQGVIQDSNGAIVLNLMQQDSVALRVTMRLGWQVPNPINRLNPTEATRFPLATLIP
jgi:HK97 family phage major capsid protein